MLPPYDAQQQIMSAIGDISAMSGASSVGYISAVEGDLLGYCYGLQH